ncbi:MAG: hypothetical protein LBS21_06870 [Clostridiales bacterium]|nr:hypothetical protein [Clostridiales bacterium]
MRKKYIENCRLVKKFGHPGRENNEQCTGFFRDDESDESLEECEKCPLNASHSDPNLILVFGPEY